MLLAEINSCDILNVLDKNMPLKTFSDGFPKDPIQAIDYSYFLSSEQKTEWKEWLTTASEDQVKDLVDTLHAMWVENQNNAVPSGFNTKKEEQSANVQPSNSRTSQSIEPQQAAELEKTEDNTLVQEKKENKKLTDPFEFATNDEVSLDDTFDISDPFENSEKVSKVFGKANKSDKAVKEFGSTPYTPNPVLEEDDFLFFDENVTKNKVPTETKLDTKQVVKESKAKSVDQPFFNVSKVRETATRGALEDLYQKYLSSRDKNFTTSQEYGEHHAQFLDKVMEVVVNFEQVADYFESMTEKLLEMNTKIIDQAKDMTSFKTSITQNQRDLEDEVDELRRDVDRLFREVKDIKTDVRRNYSDVTEKISLTSADSYGSQGFAQQLDLLNAKVHKLELQTKQIGRKSISERMQGGGRHQSKKISVQGKEQRKQKEVDDGKDKPLIDLRNII